MLRGISRLLLLFAFFVSIQQTVSAQQDTWVVSAGSPVQDYPEDVLVDDQCNTYLSGFFRDTLHFGTDSLAAAGKTDIFISKYDCNGGLLWTQRYGWFENEFAHGMAFDADGNVILVGEYQDSTILANDTIYSLDTLYYGPYSHTYDVLVLTVAPNGTLLNWVADGWFGSENFFEVAVDSRNFKVFAGLFRTFNFFGGGLWGRGYDDAFMVVMDTAHYFTWKTVASGRYIDKATAVDIIGDSLWVMGGVFQDTCYFRDSTIYQVTDFEDDIFVSCWDSSRSFRWHVTGHGVRKEYLDALEADANGNIYICGRYDSLFTLGATTLVGAGELDGFLAKIDKNGNVLWVKSIGGEYFDSANDLEIGDDGKIYVTGHFQGIVDFDGTLVSGSDSLDQDVFVAVYDGTGTLQWVRRFGGVSLDKGTAIDVDAQGYITVSGVFSGTAWFGQRKLVSRGSEDIFVMHMRNDGSVFAEGEMPFISPEMAIYPNPAQSQFTLEVSLPKATEATVRVFDIQGREILTNQSGNRRMQAGLNKVSFDTQNMVAGMYFVKVETASGTATARVVVQH